jgi:hypothetical protein
MTTDRNTVICLSLFINYNKACQEILNINANKVRGWGGVEVAGRVRKCAGQLIKYNNIEIMSSSDAYSSE